MALNKFGQYVKLTVKDRSNSVVLSTDSLRVDFDIRNIDGFVRAEVSIFNLKPEVVRKLLGGENYVTLTTSLHGGKEVVLADELFVSNSLEVTKVPDHITSLYCYSKVRRASLEKQVSLYVTNPSLKKTVQEILNAVYFKGEVKVRHFPPGYETEVSKQPRTKQEGSALSCLRILCNYYRANLFIEGNDIVIVSKVHYKNREVIEDANKIKLRTENMRSNPRIGPAVIDIQSNLDASIKPSTVLDISDLITAEVGSIGDV
ncbi:MAG: hypothetical protein KAS32_11385, partial [Candidatus Peribacteraceae bacterium]|nr:hypothetical protein [Candidatus Peribacteraceae bacterium]